MFSGPVALVEVFSLKFYIPHFNISFALSQAAEGRLSRDYHGPLNARRITAISALSQ